MGLKLCSTRAALARLSPFFPVLSRPDTMLARALMSRISQLKSTLVQRFGKSSVVARTADTRVARQLRMAAPVDDEALPVEGDVVAGLYRLARRLGEGMFGRVYVAERTDVPEHRVALKVMSRQVYGRRNVERELTMLAAATHPHIVQLKDHGMTESYVWLTMPLYDGETLAERLERGTLSLREAYEIFLPIARGVQSLHERGLRHQDIKPENIFLASFSDRLHPVLLDLGVAVEKNATFVAGTALYGAPEQLAALAGVPAKLILSEKIDTYCIASTLLYSLLGDGYYPGAFAETPFDIAAAFEERERDPLRDGALVELSDEPRRRLAAALSRWLLRDPEERPSVQQLADELDVLLDQERDAAAAIEQGIARQKRALMHVRAAASTMLVLAGVATLWAYTKRETFRRAGELERARADGAASFDELDTCNAAHEISKQETSRYRAALEHQTSEHEGALTALSSSHQEREQSLDERLTNTAGKLMLCEEDARVAADEFGAERERLEVELADHRAWADLELTTVTSQRDEHQQGRQLCETSLSSLQESHGLCRQDLASCITDRDVCMEVEDAPPKAAQGDKAPSSPQE
jgi:hypothetical protein